ncbi:MAG: hypothetical protein J0M17_18040 [Planctomycetes bacterium]|nr:hypothetical protein [Planctomycetota bacterium]
MGRYLQPPPMLFTRDGHNVFLGDSYRGHTAFLVCSGPSLRMHDLTRLQSRGFITMSVNNAATVVPTRLWACVDDPGNFSDLIWRDPGITKFVPLCHMEKPFHVRDADGFLVPSTERVGDMPAVFAYRRNENFNASQWLYEDTINWGNRGDKTDEYGNKGSRSVMYVALRLLFYLGIRRVFLVGCDFQMQVGKQNYAFPQDRTASSVRGNNNSYRILNSRLGYLKPFFDQEGFEVFNCTPRSSLTAFPYVEFDLAIEQATAHLPIQINTEGMYDRRHVRPKPTDDSPDTAGRTVAPKEVPGPQPTSAMRSSAPSVKPLASIPTELNGHSNGALSNGKPAPAAALSVTLLTTVDEALYPYWKLSVRSWARKKTGLASVPWVVGYDSHWRAATESLTEELTGHDARRMIPWPSLPYQLQREKLSASWLALAAQHVKTRWVLYLPAHTRRETDCPWFLEEWLTEDASRRTPVMISSPISFSLAAAESSHWNAWAYTVPSLAGSADLESLSSSFGNSARPRQVAPWFCLVQTEWLRAQWKLLQDYPIDTFQELFLHACAARRRDYTVTVDPSVCGWQSMAGRLRVARKLFAQAGNRLSNRSND